MPCWKLFLQILFDNDDLEIFENNLNQIKDRENIETYANLYFYLLQTYQILDDI